jgi:hypothetical protein
VGLRELKALPVIIRTELRGSTLTLDPSPDKVTLDPALEEELIRVGAAERWPAPETAMRTSPETAIRGHAVPRKTARKL